MTFEHLTSRLDLDASDYTSGASDASDASEEVTAAAGDMSDSLFDVKPAGLAAGGALAGVGTGAQESLDSTRDMRDELGIAGRTAGHTQDEMVDLATSLSDATFPIEDVTGTLASLSEQGVETEKDLMMLSEAADTIADATGTSAESVADNLGPAMAGLGDDIEDMPDIMDSIALAVNNSVLETEDLTGVMERSREELNKMGLGTEEATGLIQAYGEETGESGRELRRNFRSELEKADGDLEAFAESTGVSKNVLEEWEEELESNQGAAEDYAGVVSDNVSTMDRLRAGFSDVQLQAGQMLGPVNAIAPAMQTAGIAAMTMSTINTSAVIPSIVAKTAAMGTMAATAVGTAVPALTSVAVAAAPVAAPLLAITAAGAALYAAWQTDFLGFQTITRDTVANVKKTLGAVPGWLSDTKGKIMSPINDLRKDFPATIIGGVEASTDFIRNWTPGQIVWDKRDSILEPIDDLRDAAPESIDETVELASDVFTNWHPAGIIWDKRDSILEPIDDLRDAAPESVSEATSMASDALESWSPASIVSDKTSAMTDALPSASDWRDRAGGLVSAFVSGLEDNIPDVEGAVDSLTDKASSYLPGSNADEGAWADLTGMGASLPETIASGIPDGEDELESGMENMTDTGGPGEGRVSDLASSGRPESDGNAPSGGAGKAVTIVIEKLVADNPRSAANELKREMRSRNLTRS